LNTVSKDLQTYFPCMLQLLVTHAPAYLTREECKARLTRHLSEYYRFLGKSLVLGRDNQFWDYHKGELIRARVGFSRARLAKGALATLNDAALNPKHALERLLGRRSLQAVRRIPDIAHKLNVISHKAAEKQETTI
jgi:hypothetical protein